MNRWSKLILTSGLGLFAACATNDEEGFSLQTQEALPVGTDATEDALVLAERDGGAPAMIYGSFRTLGGAPGRGAFAPALTQASKLLRVPSQDLVFARAEVDDLGFSHARYQQTKNGLDVVGGDVRLHADARGNVFAVNGSVALTETDPADAQLLQEDAEATALTLENVFSLGGETRLVYQVTDDHAGSHLAWEVTVVGETVEGPLRDKVYVDALSGEITERLPQIHFAKTRDIYSANHAEELPGEALRGEGDAESSNADVNAAYDNLGHVHDYFFETYQLDSFDGQGASLIATVNFGRDYVNAYWNGEQMVFGDGDGKNADPLARSLDVTAHELTHAVTERSAGLNYSGESGGLNESMSDIFGNTIEAWTRGGQVSDATWMVGEDVWTPGKAGDALRYMDDPAKDGDSIDTYKDMTSWLDVHYSSGLANLAYKLLVTGGTHPRNKTSVEVPGLGLEKSAAIFYRALTKYMNSRTNFEGARTATAQAAKDLYGAEEVNAVHKAWDAIEVPGSPSTGGGGGSSGGDTLTSGSALTGLSGEKREKTFYKIEVPAGTARLTVTTSGGTGDVDLYLRYAKQPSTLFYDAKSKNDGNDDQVSLSSPREGTYYVMLRAYKAYADVSLQAEY